MSQWTNRIAAAGAQLRLEWALGHVAIKGQRCELELTLEDGLSISTLFVG